MLPKRHRADKKAVVKIFKEGKFINSPVLTLKFLMNPDPGAPRISFVVPKTVAKLSVKRNSLRRKGYSVLEKYFSRLPAGLTGVFIFKKSSVSTSEIDNEIKIILTKLKV